MYIFMKKLQCIFLLVCFMNFNKLNKMGQYLQSIVVVAVDRLDIGSGRFFYGVEDRSQGCLFVFDSKVFYIVRLFGVICIEVRKVIKMVLDYFIGCSILIWFQGELRLVYVVVFGGSGDFYWVLNGSCRYVFFGSIVKKVYCREKMFFFFLVII